MRLLFIAPDMHRGGAERQWATLIPALARRGAEARLLCLNDEGPLFDEVRAAGVPASCLHLGGRTDAPALRRALAEAGAHPGAVVTRGVSPQLVGEAVARRAGAAHVLNEHTPLTPEGELLALRPHQQGLTRLVASRVDRVIAVSEARSSRWDGAATVASGSSSCRTACSSPTSPCGRGATTPAARSAWTNATSRCCASRTCGLRRASAHSSRRWRRRDGRCRDCAGCWRATGPSERRSRR